MESNCSFMCSVQGPLLLIFTYQEGGEGGCVGSHLYFAIYYLTTLLSFCRIQNVHF